MGVLIKIDGVTFNEKYIIDKVDVPEDEPIVPVTIEDYPVQDTLKGLYDLGGTAEASLVNHAPEPQVNDGDEKLDSGCEVKEDYITFSGVANVGRMLTYLRLPLTNGLTYVALFSVPSGERLVLSNKGSKVACLSLSNKMAVIGKNNTTYGIPFDAPINSNNFAIVALRATTSGVMVDRYTNGALARVPLVVDGTKVNAYEGVVDTWDNNAVQIGGAGTTASLDTAHISLAAIHEGAMTDDQLTDICEFVKNYGEQKGLTIE